MFEGDESRVFGLPPGVDFAQALVDGLRHRLQDTPPEAIAQVELYVATQRMARRLREVFDAGPAGLLPQIKLVTDLADPLIAAQMPRPVPALRRRLELAGLVARLLQAQPDIAPQSAVFDLADSLGALMDEMSGEGVSPQALALLDVSDQSGHWQRALQFLNIVTDVFADDTAPDAQLYQRLALERKIQAWNTHPPQHPIIVAGSTGSRGTTGALMRAVTTLPQGALVLPGFDADMPGPVWSTLAEASGEDHPQYRFATLLADLDLTKTDVAPWVNAAAPAPARNAVISLALRPAPVTHQWLSEGPKLPDLAAAMDKTTLLTAPTPREEATAIAMRLRAAVEEGITAALITPDRMLTRQVTAALESWGILPDDSAGTPAQLTPPGRFLRHVAGLLEQRLTAESLLALLKHPLTHSGAPRGPHLLMTRDLELWVRKHGLPYPDAGKLIAWGADHSAEDWAKWVAAQFCDAQVTGLRPLSDWVARHIALAEAIGAGPEGRDAGGLWDENAGRSVRKIVDALRGEAELGHEMSARDYSALIGGLLAQGEVRDRDAPHPLIRIWGTLEARVMDADLMILGGLNEGSWPEMPSADPWLNRRMRADAGLLVPERRIGLSAHDFQQAAGAAEVWFTRSAKSADAETVPSRWLNRLLNLLNGLPEQGGPEVVAQMAQRGAHWIALAQKAETPLQMAPAKRPSPAPPVTARPSELPVTQIKKLIRDPYAVYAGRVLRLKPLDPLMQAPDALMRGVLTHEILERFVKSTVADPSALTADHLLDHAAQILLDPGQVPFPVTRALWMSRINRVAAWFAEGEAQRQARAAPAAFEVEGRAPIPALGFTLTGTADRIDFDDRGGAYIYDYKTGKAPSDKQQMHFDKQLLLEAAMLLQGGFKELAPKHIEAAQFISLVPGDPKVVDAPLEDVPPDQVWAEFKQLITAYANPNLGYTARRALQADKDVADYDHLSRFGEWDVTDDSHREVLS